MAMTFEQHVAAGRPAWMHRDFRYPPSGPAALAMRAAIKSSARPARDSKPIHRCPTFEAFPALSSQYSTDDDFARPGL